MAASISYLAAAGGGFISFLSPCVLPLVPAYLCYLAGTSYEDLTEKAGRDAAMTRRVVGMSMLFVLGFGMVFVALGASASAITELLRSDPDIILTLQTVAGIIIIIFGLHMIGLFRLAFLNREARMDASTKALRGPGAVLLGMAFGFGWTPCIGPILGAILAIAASEQNVYSGASLLAVYALGLGVPFVLAALGIRAFLGFLIRFRRHMRKVEIGTGVLLSITGVLFLTGHIQEFGFFLLETFPVLGTIG
ncbi:cytochrome c biogenesis CcdA family protein [Minwuia sp.]|uniref:cytochrome c biogenesis CcdA family protein n=1 Tax=Minwuia sp. TaxID=2493630 RepID=UPI003A959A69